MPNDDFWTGASIALVILSLLMGMGSCAKSVREGDAAYAAAKCRP